MRLALGQLSFNLFGVGEAFFNTLAPILQHRQHSLVRKPVQEKADDAETDHLGDEMRPVDAKSSCNLFGLPAAVQRRQHSQRSHDCPPTDAATGFILGTSRSYFTRNKA